MATVRQCRSALTRLADTLDGVDPELRSKHVPERTLLCRISDLEATFSARLDAHGLHDIELVDDPDGADGDIKVSMDSDELLALADGGDDFLHAWLQGRVQLSAPMRDLLRLRSLLTG